MCKSGQFKHTYILLPLFPQRPFWQSRLLLPDQQRDQKYKPTLKMEQTVQKVMKPQSEYALVIYLTPFAPQCRVSKRPSVRILFKHFVFWSVLFSFFHFVYLFLKFFDPDNIMRSLNCILRKCKKKLDRLIFETLLKSTYNTQCDSIRAKLFLTGIITR